MVSVLQYYQGTQSFTPDFALLNTIWNKFSFVSQVVPVEEKRIFLFVDLNNSTMLAERMGHVKYSMFLSTYFLDFQKCVEDTKGEIYQYVGDEVVVSWKLTQRNLHESVNLISCFTSTLQRRAEYYERAFNHVPDFKAALHHGEVAVTRIGAQKVFHGDVLNTCSRMIELASKTKNKLVCSDEVTKTLKTGKFEFNEIENAVIRGRRQQMRVFTIS